MADAPSLLDESPQRESRWGGAKAAFAAILAGAAALRLVGIQYGLPFGNLFNPDEPSVVPRAWDFAHGAGADPHWFDYPTLLIYALAPTQLGSDRPSYLAARAGVVVLALGAVAATWWLAHRAYGSALAGAVAAAIVAIDTTHVAYSRMAVTDVPLTLGVSVSLALMLRGPVELAGIAVGVATGFKYPGVLLLAPLVVAGWGRWWRLAASLALAAGAFLATSPYLAVHPGQAWDDFSRVNRLARAGWLGYEHDHWAGVAFVGHLWDGMGPVLVLAFAGLVVALVRRTRADLVLAVFVGAYFLNLLTLHAHFDRYVLPLVPALAVLASRLRTLAPVTLLLLVVPLAWTIRDDAHLTRTDTRVAAAHWIAANVPRGATLALDPSTPHVAGYRLVYLSLPGPRQPHDPLRDVARLRGEGIRYLVVTGAVADRVLAAADRYPREARFYRGLHDPAYAVEPGGDLFGPWVRVYHLES